MRQVRRAELSKPSPTSLPVEGHLLQAYTGGPDYDLLDGLKIGNWAGRIFEVEESTGTRSTIIYIHNVAPSRAFVEEPKK